MATDYPQIDTVLQHFGFYRLEPRATLPGRYAVEAQALAAGIALPDDYVYFCSAHGAGAFDKHSMLTLPPGCALGRDFRLDTLYAVGAGEDWNPITLLEDTYLDRLPEGLLPIGSDPGESLLLLGTADRAGAYVWDHEHCELTDGQLERCVADLKYAMVDTEQLDIDQILLLWDEMFPARVINSSGYGNLYRVADSFTDALMVLRGVPIN
jgi:hypothetical protein